MKRYYLMDHLGSIRTVVGQSGETLVRYDYDTFGNRTESEAMGGYSCALGYTEHYLHGASGLWLTWYRAYEPSTGRWLSRDPIGKKSVINLYDYVKNSTMRFYDPDGKNPFLLAVVGGTCNVVWGFIVNKINKGNEWKAEDYFGNFIQGASASFGARWGFLGGIVGNAVSKCGNPKPLDSMASGLSYAITGRISGAFSGQTSAGLGCAIGIFGATSDFFFSKFADITNDFFDFLRSRNDQILPPKSVDGDGGGDSELPRCDG